MTIITNSFYCTGSMCNIPVSANVLQNPGFSNLVVASDLRIQGVVHTTNRMDTGATIYATFRPPNMLSLGDGQPQVHGGTFQFDWTGADMSAMDGMPLAVPRPNILNSNTGVVTVPVSGLYNLYMQGSFSNNEGFSNPINGVYYYFQNQSFAGSRRAAVFSPSQLVSTNTTQYLLAGERIQPMYYSSDPNAKLLANGESYIGFSVINTVTPTHSNYFRV